MGNIKEKKVGVAGLKPTRYDNSKGTRIGPSLFYASKLKAKYTQLIYKEINDLSTNTSRFIEIFSPSPK
jgi:hypothetical protein